VDISREYGEISFAIDSLIETLIITLIPRIMRNSHYQFVLKICGAGTISERYARSNVFAHIFSESSFWNPILFQHYFVGIIAVTFLSYKTTRINMKSTLKFLVSSFCFFILYYSFYIIVYTENRVKESQFRIERKFRCQMFIIRKIRSQDHLRSQI